MGEPTAAEEAQMTEPRSEAEHLLERRMFDAALSAAITYATAEVHDLHERIYQLERQVAALDAECLRLREERRAALSGSSVDPKEQA